MAKLNHNPGQDFIQKWIEVASNKLKNFNTQDLAVSVYALLKLNCDLDQNCINKWIEAASSKLEDFSPIGLDISINALKEFTYNPKYTPNATSIKLWINNASSKLKGFNLQEVAIPYTNTNGYKTWAFYNKLYNSRKENKKDFHIDCTDWIKELVTTDFDWSDVSFENFWGAFLTISKEVSKVELTKLDTEQSFFKVHETYLGQYSNTKDLIQSLYGFARFRHSPESIQKWTDVAYNKLEHFNYQELSNSIWALAKLNHNPGQDFIQKWTEVASIAKLL